MDEQARADKMLRLGLLINRIATLSDDETLKRIKPTLEALEQELLALFEQIKEVQ